MDQKQSGRTHRGPAALTWQSSDLSSPEAALLLLLLFLAADAEGRDRARLEPLRRDLLLALLADAEAAGLDASERLVDLGQQELLAVAQPEDHRLRVLARRLID